MNYTVGKADNGETLLTIGKEFHTTLGMNEAATVQMIRLLAATLEHFNIEVKRIDNE